MCTFQEKVHPDAPVAEQSKTNSSMSSLSMDVVALLDCKIQGHITSTTHTICRDISSLTKFRRSLSFWVTTVRILEPSIVLLHM
jgi:hypothetical protein